MPGIDAITAAILEDANRDAQATLDEARAKAQEIESQAAAKADRSAGELTGQAAQEAAEYGRRMESMADLTCRRARLEVKQQLLDELFDRTLQAMGRMDDGEYRAFVGRLLLEAAGGDEQVVIGEGENRIDEAFLTGINEKLKESGRKGALTLAPQREAMTGGFILRSHGVELNSSFEMLVRQARPTLEKEAASLLFDA